MKEKVLEKIASISKEAYNAVPLYASFEKDGLDKNVDIESLKVVNKEDFIYNKESVISAHYIMDVLNNRDILTMTSLSHSQSLQVLWNIDEYKHSLLSVWIYRKKYYDINPNCKLSFFYEGRLEGESVENDIWFIKEGETVGFSSYELNDDKVRTIYKMMDSFKIEWLIVRSSIALVFAKIIEKYNLQKIKSLRYIELIDEFLTRDEKKCIEEAFKCKVAFHYAIKETNTIAYECPHGNIHVAEKNVFLEIVENGRCLQYGEEGDICITSLNNHVMPFIRYKIGDRGKLLCGKDCGCGNENDILKITKYNRADFLFCKGKYYSAADLLNAIELTNINCDNCINKFQFIQISENEIVAFIEMNSQYISNIRFNEKVLNVFVNSIRDRVFHEFKFNINFIEKIYFESGQYFINALGKDKEYIDNIFIINKCIDKEYN